MILTKALEHIRLHADTDSFLITYDPNHSVPGTGEVMLGFGRTQEKRGGIVLNHKYTAYASLTSYVLRLEEQSFSQWREQYGSPHSLTYCMEDLSPDTCLGFIVFYCRWLGVQTEEFPSFWIHYVERWEAGDVTSTGAPFESWGCLHSALAHVYLHTKDPASFLHGFYACLNLDIEVLLKGYKPDAIPLSIEGTDSIKRARIYLTQEQQEYQSSLASSTRLQLQIPVKGSQRSLLVDAYIATEKQALGVKKAFLRNDSNTFLQSGYSLMALYRPSHAGSGNDMVISVDPNLGIHLEHLWRELEREEDLRWEGARPADRPRFPERSAANQPWYDEMERYTLIAAPKRVNESTLGSKLSWENVVDLLWRTYYPAQSLFVQPYTSPDTVGSSRPIHDCPPLWRDARSQKQFVATRWDSEGGQAALVLSPTMKRYLAACADGRRPTGFPQLDDLPEERSFDVLEITGGFILLHPQGVLYFDDWTAHHSHLPSFVEEYQHLVRRYNAMTDLRAEILREVEQARTHIQEGKLQHQALHALNQKLSRYKLELRHTLLTTMPITNDYDIQQFRELLAKRWGIQNELEELYHAVNEIENMIRSISETNTNRLVSWITIYGFPLALFAGLFEFIFADIPTPFKWGGVHWVGVVLFVLCTLISILTIRKITRKGDRHYGS